MTEAHSERTSIPHGSGACVAIPVANAVLNPENNMFPGIRWYQNVSWYSLVSKISTAPPWLKYSRYFQKLRILTILTSLAPDIKIDGHDLQNRRFILSICLSTLNTSSINGRSRLCGAASLVLFGRLRNRFKALRADFRRGGADCPQIPSFGSFKALISAGTALLPPIFPSD